MRKVKANLKEKRVTTVTSAARDAEAVWVSCRVRPKLVHRCFKHLGLGHVPATSTGPNRIIGRTHEVLDLHASSEPQESTTPKEAVNISDPTQYQVYKSLDKLVPSRKR